MIATKKIKNKTVIASFELRTQEQFYHNQILVKNNFFSTAERYMCLWLVLYKHFFTSVEMSSRPNDHNYMVLYETLVGGLLTLAS